MEGKREENLKTTRALEEFRNNFRRRPLNTVPSFHFMKLASTPLNYLSFLRMDEWENENTKASEEVKDGCPQLLEAPPKFPEQSTRNSEIFKYKLNSHSAITLMRRLKEGDVAMSLSGSPLHVSSVIKDSKPALALPLVDGTVKKRMSAIMQEYEKMISRVGKEQAKQKWKIEQENLKKEIDEVLTHLSNLQQEFSDVHRKYERCKTAIEEFKSYEEALLVIVAECQAHLSRLEQRYEGLKSYAEEGLESAIQEFDGVSCAQQLEITKLHAMIRKTELRLASLEGTVKGKEKENQGLSAIVDKLIGNLEAVRDEF